jgi:DNA-directed RNA polymerase beta' subunit
MSNLGPGPRRPLDLPGNINPSLRSGPLTRTNPPITVNKFQPSSTAPAPAPGPQPRHGGASGPRPVGHARNELNSTPGIANRPKNLQKHIDRSMMDEIRLEDLILSLASTEEIINESRICIDTPNDNKFGNRANRKKVGMVQNVNFHGTLNDPRMGTNTALGTACETCTLQSDPTTGRYKCPGHIGYLPLAQRIINPLYVREMAYILSCVCNDCSKLLVTAEELEIPEIKSSRGLNRLGLLHKLCESSEHRCSRADIDRRKARKAVIEKFFNINAAQIIADYRSKIPVGTSDTRTDKEILNLMKTYANMAVSDNNPLYENLQQASIIQAILGVLQNNFQQIEEDIKQCMPNPSKISYKKDLHMITGKLKATQPIDVQYHPELFPWEKHQNVESVKNIYLIVSNIPIEDVINLGFGERVLPTRMLQDTLIVIPPDARPAFPVKDENNEHSITTIYNNILKHNKIMSDNKDNLSNLSFISSSKFRETKTLYEEAYKHLIVQYNRMLSDKDATGNNGLSGFCGLVKGFNGKDGFVRKELIPKRVDYAARVVISPDTSLKFGEASVPSLFRPSLTKPEDVTPFTIKLLQALGNTGEIRQIRRNGKQKKWLPNMILHVGDIVERYLQDGDGIIINRQPTLHSHSYMRVQVRISSRKTMGLDMAYTGPYNADFDGDEMNLQDPQTIGAEVEAFVLMDVRRKIIDPKNNRNIMGAVFDAVTGMHILTKNNPIISDKIWLDVISNPNLSVYVSYQVKTLQKRLDMYKIHNRSGRAMFSLLLPADFKYKSGSIDIRNGVLITGAITSAHIGAKYNSIVQTIHKYYGADRAGHFINDVYQINDQWFSTYGFSIGYQDCKIDNIGRDEIAKNIQDARTVEIYSIFLAINDDGSINNDTLLSREQILQNPDSDVLLALWKKFSMISTITNSDATLLNKDFMQYYNHTSQLRTLNKRFEDNNPIPSKVGVPGRKLISSALPEDLNWDLTNVDDREQRLPMIVNGIIIEPFDYESTPLFLSVLIANYDLDKVSKILADIQMAILFYIGEDDKYEGKMQKEVNKIIETSRLQMEALGEMPTDPIAKLYYTKLSSGYLRTTTNAGERLLSENMNRENNIITSINAGTKGAIMNVGQVIGSIGQQWENGSSLMGYEMTECTRVFPAFIPGENSLESRGMVINSFSRGMNAVELMFHQKAGRTGLTDTAVKTSESGTAFRRIGRVLENIKVAPNGAVLNGKGGIVQPTVYHSGLDPAKLIRIKFKTGLQDDAFIPAFIDVMALADHLNSKYGAT